MGKLASCLWVNQNKDVEKMAEFYLTLFEETEKIEESRFVEDAHGETGKLLTIGLVLGGHEFVLLNGGENFEMTPAISYVVNCDTREKVQHLWSVLSENGEVLMELSDSDLGYFGWVNDQFGTSWQVMLEEKPQEIFPSLMFVNEHYGKAEQAMKFYLDTFGNGQELFKQKAEDGSLLYGQFTLFDQLFGIMDSSASHEFNFSLANSLIYYCENQQEIDRIWTAMTAEGQESQCGWLYDPYGVSWQIVTRELQQLTNGPDKKKARAATEAMYQMKKLDIALLKKAYDEA